MTKTQYALVDAKDGSPATLTHQDDMETPIVADTLGGLLDLIGIWVDRGGDDVAAELRGDLFPDDYDETKFWKIVRQDIITNDLAGDDLAELQRMQREAT